MDNHVFGIDLGTTYSCIAYVDETDRAVIVDNMDGQKTTPSVVNFSSPYEVVVGQAAKEYAVLEPQTTASFVKSLMGKTNFAISYNGEDKTPEEVSSYILRKVAEDAERNTGISVKDVVITCPAYFGTAERTATKNAGIIAGLNVLEIISEPTAAAVYYGCTRKRGKKTVMVYDLGGGTFDVTIMSIEADKIEVICSDGNHELGGKDWDEVVMSYLANQFMEQTGYQGDISLPDQQDLRLNAEKIKKLLSARSEASIKVTIGGIIAMVNLTRDVFNEITAFLLYETISKTDAAMEVAKSKGYSIDEILLVGGSTRMPQVRNILMEKYRIEPKMLEPDEAVAKGAAIYANMLVQGKVSGSSTVYDDTEMHQGRSSHEPQIIVATTKSFALRIVDENDGGKLKCRNMIIKNQPMQEGYVSVTDTFYTTEDGQEEVELAVYESDIMDLYYDPDPDYKLGHAFLELTEYLPRHSPIQVTFKLNREGILEVTGQDMKTYQTVYATMKAKGIMEQEKVEHLKEKSKMVAVKI